APHGGGQPARLPRERRPEDRCLVRVAESGRSAVRRRGGRVSQHQYARGARPRMTGKIGTVPISQVVSCLDGYDPDALHVDKAREAMRACVTPISETETLAIRAALGRVLAQEIVPSINVPAHDNSAMDGYAVRYADIDKPLTEIGTALAGKPFPGNVGAGQCVRVMTGAVMPAGTDTVG